MRASSSSSSSISSVSLSYIIISVLIYHHQVLILVIIKLILYKYILIFALLLTAIIITVQILASKAVTRDSTMPLETPSIDNTEDATDNIMSVFVDKNILQISSLTYIPKESIFKKVYIINGSKFSDEYNMNWEYNSSADEFVNFELEEVGVPNKINYNLDNEYISSPEIMSEYSEDEDVSDEELKVVIVKIDSGYLIDSTVYLTDQQWHTTVKYDERTINCVICDVYFELYAFDEHIASDFHIKQLETCKPLKQFELSVIRKINENYYCSVCNAVYPFYDEYRHLNDNHEQNLLTAILKASDITEKNSYKNILCGTKTNNNEYHGLNKPKTQLANNSNISLINDRAPLNISNNNDINDKTCDINKTQTQHANDYNISSIKDIGILNISNNNDINNKPHDIHKLEKKHAYDNNIPLIKDTGTLNTINNNDINGKGQDINKIKKQRVRKTSINDKNLYKRYSIPTEGDIKSISCEKQDIKADTKDIKSDNIDAGKIEIAVANNTAKPKVNKESVHVNISANNQYDLLTVEDTESSPEKDIKKHFNINEKHDIKFMEEYIQLMIKKTHFVITQYAYNTIMFFAERKHCFVCSVMLYDEQLTEHVESLPHFNNLVKFCYLDIYSKHLIRQNSHNFHCGICNVEFCYDHLQKHLDWTKHRDRSIQCKTKKHLRNTMKTSSAATKMEEKITSAPPKFKLLLNARILATSAVDNIEETTHVACGGTTIEKSMVENGIIKVNVNGRNFNVKYCNWHGVVRNKNDFKCIICRKVLTDHIEIHCRLHTDAVLMDFVKKYSPQWLRKVTEKVVHCVVCNKELLINEENIQEHLKAKKHKRYHEVLMKGA